MSKVEEYLKTLSNYEEDSCVVVFQNLKGVYPSSQNLPCEFVLKEPLSSIEQCRLSIFPVGWNNFESSISSKDMINLESNVKLSGIYRCEFDQMELPGSNYDEFYQFCLYDYELKMVYGASCPFQIIDKIEEFGNVYTNDHGSKIFTTSFEDMDWWMEQQQSLEFNDDTVLVHNKTTMLEAALAKSVEENEKLKCQNASLEKELDTFQKQLTEAENLWRDSNIQKVSLLQGRIDNLLEEEDKKKLKLSEYESLIQNLMKQIVEYKSMQQNLLLNDKEYLNDLGKMKLLVKKYENMISDQNQLLSKLKQEKNDLKCQTDYASERIAKYENMLEVQNTDTIKKLELKLKQLEFDNKNMQSELELVIEDKNMQLKLVTSLKAENEKNLKTWDNEIALLRSENEKLKYDIEKLNLDNAFLLKSCNKMKEDFILQLKSSKENSKLEKENEIRVVNEKLYEKETQLICLMENEKLLKEEIKNLKIAIEEEQFSARQTKESLNEIQKQKPSFGPETTLHFANAYLKKELVKANEESKHYQKLYSELLPQMKDLLKLNDELKYRLEIGKKACENKYSQYQKLEKELSEFKKNQGKSTENDDKTFQNEAKLKILALQEDLERTRKSEMQLRMDYKKLFDDIQLQKKANSKNDQPDLMRMLNADELLNIYLPPSASTFHLPPSASTFHLPPSASTFHLPPSNLNFSKLSLSRPPSKPSIFYPPGMDMIDRDLQIPPKKISNEPEVQIMH